MIKIIGLRKPVYEHITDTYDNVLAYVNEAGNIIEFCEFSYLRTYDDHVEVEVSDIDGLHVLIPISNIDFYRIEIE